MYNTFFSSVTAGAMVPEQLVHYVRAVADRRPLACASCIAYVHNAHAVLVAYPGLDDPGSLPRSAWAWEACCPENGKAPALPPEAGRPSLAEPLALVREHCSSLTVLAPFRPLEAPAEASSTTDCYWHVKLPLPAPGQKLRNMLRRAARELSIQKEYWTHEHELLVQQYLATRPLAPGARAVYGNLNAYAPRKSDGPPLAAPGVVLFAARRPNGSLAAFTIGDFSALQCAFYMFAFRQNDAPPGTADLLLHSFMEHALSMGHEQVNLGLAINSGIAFFKKKWGAEPFAPYVETSWKFPAAKTATGPLAAIRRFFTT